MEQIRIPAQDGTSARQRFYQLIGQVPESETEWADRQRQLQSWRLDPDFEPFWRAIDQMLTVDFCAFQRRVALTPFASDAAVYDVEAWRQQREYDAAHARDHVP
jgi:hypothetical protein